MWVLTAHLGSAHNDAIANAADLQDVRAKGVPQVGDGLGGN
jgi:hypothetical protein